MLTPLYPLRLGRDFQVGDVLNGRYVPHCLDTALCHDESRDYTGGDPEIQFPTEWHVKAGFGNQSGGFHQDLARFHPWRVKVVKARDGVGPNHIRIIGGGLRAGGAVLSKWFDAVPWADKQPLRAKFVLIPSSRSANQRLYFNVELRGLLNFTVKKNEATVAFGLHLTTSTIKAKYWHDGYDGIDARERREIVRLHALRLDRRYKFDLLMTPIEPEYTWRVDATLRVLNETVWELHTDRDTSPNGIVFLSQVALGDEQEKNFTGGVWYVARAQCWTGTGALDDDDAD